QMEKSLLFVAIFLFEAFKIGTGTGLGNKGNDSYYLAPRLYEKGTSSGSVTWFSETYRKARMALCLFIIPFPTLD
ncbi:hypothetical protein, partial [Streptococcus rupicaprae]|uniref:hypothetical protein n=1 Tax=Streptococcus rupicaprae TaxID=759619 RepID=UPI0033962F92